MRSVPETKKGEAMRFLEYLRQLGLGLSAVILLPLAIHYGFRAFSPVPKDIAGSEEELYRKINNLHGDREKIEKALKKGGRRGGTAQLDEINEKITSFEDFKHAYQRKKLYVRSVLGLVFLLGGSVITSPLIGFGLILGSVVSLFFTLENYWNYMDDMAKFLVMLISLLIAVGLGGVLFRRMGSK